MIVVTGASGYVGSHITQRLVERGKSVRALVRNVELAKKEQRLKDLAIEWFVGDVAKPDTLDTVMDHASAVIHTVAIAVEKDGRTYESINYQGTVNVVEAAKKAGVRRFINISQLGAEAQIPYRFLASKGRAQDVVAASGLDWTAFRPSVIWGPEDEFANTFARLIPITPLIFPIVGNQNTKFQPVWVEDVAACVEKSLEDPNTIGKQYELGGPEILTLEEIERRTMLAIGAKRMMIHFPLWFLKPAVALMEKLLPAPPVTRSLLELLAVSNVTKNNAIYRFVENPKAFTADETSIYMRQFRIKDTLAQFMGKS